MVVALSAVLIGAASTLSGPAAAAAPVGVVVFTFERASGAYGEWLETGDLAGQNRRALTPAPSLKTQRFDEDASLSPDGTKVAFIREGQRAGNQLYVVNSDGSDLHLVAGPDDVGRGIPSFAWSPAGDALAFAREAEDDLPSGGYTCNTRLSQLNLGLVQPDGGNLRFLSPIPGALAPTPQHPLNLRVRGWSPDGTKILYRIYRWDDGECVNYPAHLDSTTILQITSDGTGVTQLFQDSAPIGEVSYSPSGDRIARSSYQGSFGLRPCDLVIRSIATARTRTLHTHSLENCNNSGGLSFGWLTANKIVFSDGLRVGLLDLTTGAARTIVQRKHLPRSCQLRGNAAVCEEVVAALSSDGSEAAVIDDPDDLNANPSLRLVGLNDHTTTQVPTPTSTNTSRPASEVTAIDVQLG